MVIPWLKSCWFSSAFSFRHAGPSCEASDRFVETVLDLVAEDDLEMSMAVLKRWTRSADGRTHLEQFLVEHHQERLGTHLNVDRPCLQIFGEQNAVDQLYSVVERAFKHYYPLTR